LKYADIVEIGDILVSSEILTEYFFCDYDACGGACCLEGDGGAPLEEREADILKDSYDEYSAYMTDSGKNEVIANGFYYRDKDGDIVTSLVDGRECAFSCRDKNGNFRCAVEIAFEKNEIAFRKPVSCSLYPIRYKKLSNGMTALNLHKWSICRSAFDLGKHKGIRVFEFLRKPLIEKFGNEFYSDLEEAFKMLTASS
jgi:hypothetical protein